MFYLFVSSKSVSALWFSRQSFKTNVKNQIQHPYTCSNNKPKRVCVWVRFCVQNVCALKGAVALNLSVCCSSLMHNHNPPWSWIWADVDKCLVGLSEFGCLMRRCGRVPELTNYLIWLNSCCFVRFCSGDWSKCVFVCDSSHRWVLGAEYRSEHPPLTSLQAWLLSDANSFSWGAPCLMHYMQAHNCKLHYNDYSAFARHRCQSKYFWNTEAAVGYWFSVICRNKHFNQSIPESHFFPPLARLWLRQKRNCGKGKAATFFLFGEQGMKEQEGCGGSRTDRESVVQPKNEEF